MMLLAQRNFSQSKKLLLLLSIILCNFLLFSYRAVALN
jgi:hypothetical protein